MLGETAIVERGVRKGLTARISTSIGQGRLGPPTRVSVSRIGPCRKEIRVSHATGIRQEEVVCLAAADLSGFLAMAEVARAAMMTTKEMVMEVRRIEAMADRDHPMDKAPQMEEMDHLEEAGRREADRREGIGPLVGTGPQVEMDLREEDLDQEVVAWRI